jgi:phosphopantothenoylcysteine decarboxylase/phosphopantothenate--cysteine ligase
VVIAPAMNTTMWNHPTTQRNIRQLIADGVRVIEPDAGEMACGTFGPGRLSHPESIVATVLEILRECARHQEQDMSGERILITTGATREELDPVRFLSNRSSGRMGFALAEAARSRGAEVTVVAGASTAEPPAKIEIIRAVSAEEMRTAVMKEVAAATVFISAAAVSDYRPSSKATSKIKKSEAGLTLALEPTPDILAEVAEMKSDGLLVIGFAAETDDALNNGKAKLERKRLDAIVVNDITREGAGFDTETNIITIVTRTGPPVELSLMSKLDAAHRILDEIANLRGQSIQPAPEDHRIASEELYHS